MPRTYSSRPIPFTAAPLRLIISDLSLWFMITFVLPPAGLPSLIFPIGPFNSGRLAEFYPSFGNYWGVFVHIVLIIIQATFLITLIPGALGVAPPWISGYTPVWIAYILGFVLVTRWVSDIVLNGGDKEEYTSDFGVTDDEKKKFANEKWVFVNGVAAGQHWMQSNMDRLALTFRREILGIHNKTRGVIFDLIECILERTLGWATPSTRKVYTQLLEIISDDSYERVVLILHSQGAIEGGLALDWLFATVPASLLGRVEVYTFGAAANHFNNPSFSALDEADKPVTMPPEQDGRILRYIEHYANDTDYVSQFGILNFRLNSTRPRRFLDLTAAEEAQNMYAGRLFIRQGTGHQFGGNYLDNLFTLNSDRTQVLDNNTFMDSEIDESLLKSSEIVSVKEPSTSFGNRSFLSHLYLGQTSGLTLSSQDSSSNHRRRKSISFNPRVKDVSRLWAYRNGGTPLDDDTSNKGSNENSRTSVRDGADGDGKDNNAEEPLDMASLQR